MALINCPECGHQMSDTAKKCPNCGYVFHNSKLDTIKPYILGGLIGIIGLLVTMLSFPVMSGWGGSIDPISDDFYMGCAMFLCGLIVLFIGCKKLRNNFNQSMLIFWGLTALSVVSLVIFFLSVGFHHWEISTTDEQIVQNSTEGSQQTNDVENDFTGTYNVKDASGKEWNVIVNEDNTVVVEGENNSEYYGSWMEFDGKIETTFTSEDFIYPPLEFPTSSRTDGMYLVIDVKENFIYASNSSKSKNPRKRLPIVKQQ